MYVYKELSDLGDWSISNKIKNDMLIESKSLWDSLSAGGSSIPFSRRLIINEETGYYLVTINGYYPYPDEQDNRYFFFYKNKFYRLFSENEWFLKFIKTTPYIDLSSNDDFKLQIKLAFDELAKHNSYIKNMLEISSDLF